MPKMPMRCRCAAYECYSRVSMRPRTRHGAHRLISDSAIRRMRFCCRQRCISRQRLHRRKMPRMMRAPVTSTRCPKMLALCRRCNHLIRAAKPCAFINHAAFAMRQRCRMHYAADRVPRRRCRARSSRCCRAFRDEVRRVRLILICYSSPRLRRFFAARRREQREPRQMLAAARFCQRAQRCCCCCRCCASFSAAAIYGDFA